MDLGQRFCPGSLATRQPKPRDLECHRCEAEVEIWSDEIKVRCPNCSALVTCDVPPSCIDWCKWAEECIGSETYERLKRQEE